YKRATTAQKCVRAGGKHNDLDNVGYTARHHTFFEMLGNFSFGDYFKSDAIPFAWEMVTKELAIPKDKLLVTVYETDDEAAEIWKKVAGISDNRIIRIGDKPGGGSDNFWQMGPTGPCGPCTEIFYDHGEKFWGGPPGSPEEDGDRFIEIWNLVFMQYEQFEDGSRRELTAQSIDTGMGIERVAALLQGTNDNYATDLMRALIEDSAHKTSTDPDGPGKTHHRVIADHLRSTSFLIADGVMPSNDGRGYVLRRIMRRAMRHAHLLGSQDPLMHRLVPELVRQMGEAYPELRQAQALIEETLKLEETRFRQTLDRGLKLLDEELAGLTDDQALPGEAAFKLYDTYGFPLDLTQDALREKG
ncbi:MAG: alanine--tRNA ligase, partial [Pseudomonadota bacterium]|nr:alanine--tRNA ligase [Pseudomonadota bacterium]